MTSKFTPFYFQGIFLLSLATVNQASTAVINQKSHFNINIKHDVEVDPSIKKSRKLATRFVNVVFKLMEANQKYISISGLDANALSTPQKFLQMNAAGIPHCVKKALKDYDFLVKNTEEECRLSSSLKILVEQINTIIIGIGFKELVVEKELYNDPVATLDLIESSIIKLESFYETYKDNPTWKDAVADFFNGSYFATHLLPDIVQYAVTIGVVWAFRSYNNNVNKVKVEAIAAEIVEYEKLVGNGGKGVVKDKKYSANEQYYNPAQNSPKITDEVKAAYEDMAIQIAYNKIEKLTEKKKILSAGTPLLSFSADDASPASVGMVIGGIAKMLVISSQSIKRQARLAEEEKARKLSKILDSCMVVGSGVEFKDIIGYEDVKQLFHVLIDSLSNPLAYHSRGINIPQGIFMYGPPGVGKTMFMKALATEASRAEVFNQNKKISCIAINANLLAASTWYTSKDIIDALYAKAYELAPCIIFIDEIDGVINPKDSENRSFVETNLLMAWDGIQKNQNANPAKPVITVIGSNHPDRFRIEFTRAGRMDIKVPFIYPDAVMRQIFLKRGFFDNDNSNPLTFSSENLFNWDEKFKSIVIAPEDVITPSNLAERIEGYSDAQIKALINLARLIAQYERASNLDDPKYLSIAKKFIGVPEAAKTPEL